jgi:hypothetical protein
LCLLPEGRPEAPYLVWSPDGIAECLWGMIKAMHLLKTLGNKLLQMP